MKLQEVDQHWASRVVPLAIHFSCQLVPHMGVSVPWWHCFNLHRTLLPGDCLPVQKTALHHCVWHETASSSNSREVNPDHSHWLTHSLILKSTLINHMMMYVFTLNLSVNTANSFQRHSESSRDPWLSPAVSQTSLPPQMWEHATPWTSSRLVQQLHVQVTCMWLYTMQFL